MAKFVATLTNAATDSINVIQMRYAITLTLDTNVPVRAVLLVTDTLAKMATNALPTKTTTATSTQFAPTLPEAFPVLVKTGSTATVKRVSTLTSARAIPAVTTHFA